MPTMKTSFWTMMEVWVLALMMQGACVLRADWPQFRGPLGNGLAPDGRGPQILRLDADLAWKVELPGRGLSSPVVVGGRVFVTCGSGVKQDLFHVLCFEAAAGRLLWERQFWATGRTLCHEKTSMAAPTPASDGSFIYVLYASNDAACFDLDGNLRWFRGLGRDYPVSGNNLGMSSSPVVVDGVMVAQIEAQGEAFTVGLDAVTGTNRWKLSRVRGNNWTSPQVARVGGGEAMVLLQSAKGLMAVRPVDGHVVWTHEVKASTVPSGAVSGGMVYLPAGGIQALELAGLQTGPKELWTASPLRTGTSSPVVAEDFLYLLNDAGVLSCAERGSGRRVWQLRLKGPFSGSPVVAGSRLYCVNEEGLLQWVDLAKAEGEKLGEIALGDTVLSTPALSGGALYVRGEKTLWRLGRSGN